MAAIIYMSWPQCVDIDGQTRGHAGGDVCGNTLHPNDNDNNHVICVRSDSLGNIDFVTALHFKSIHINKLLRPLFH